MKQLSIFIIAIYVLAFLNSFQLTFSLNSNSILTETKNTKKKEKADDSKVLWSGWVKYFHYETYQTIKKPTEFFINNSYYSQKVPKAELKGKDSKGVYNNVTDKYSFYAILFEDSLNILSEKNLHFTKTVDTMSMDLIKPFDANEPLKGSIKDLGGFNEGYCVSIKLLKPGSFQNDFLPVLEDNTTKSESWIVCMESPTKKDEFYTTLMTYKLLNQKKHGIQLVVRESSSKGDKPKTTPQIERYEGPDANPSIDGYLMLVQDWIQCTLKCGGGESYQQLRCIPPKSGGKPCFGDLIRKKSCNEQPCPGVSVGAEKTEEKKDEEEQITFKPIFKSQPFVDRPQQDIPCVIKENDVLYEKYDEKNKINVKVPGRLLINNRTIALFEDNNYDNAAFSFNLKETELKLNKFDHCCFYIQSLNKRQQICALANCGSKADPKFLNSWKYSFSLFKNKCFREMNSLHVSHNEPEKNEEVQGSTLASMNIDSSEVDEREKLINSKLNEETELFLDKKLEKNQQTALKALTRELNLEERLKREEMMKAKEETKVVLSKMNFEIKKKEKLEEALEEKEEQDVQLKSQRETTRQASSILTETEEEINKKRNQLKKKILEIRKMTERRKRLIESKISLIRGKMTEEIVQANKAGSIETCQTTKENPAEIKKYCDDNITSDYNKNLECKTEEGFCYACCESEFGAVQYNNRAKCYDMCDGNEKKKKDAEKPRGDWIWKVNGN